MTEGKNTGAWEYLRIATPVLTTLGLFIVAMVGNSLGNSINRMDVDLSAQISKIDDKLFKHLTNDDMHVLRSTAVDKQQFDLINQIRASQIADLKADICDIKTLVLENRVRLDDERASFKGNQGPIGLTGPVGPKGDTR